MSITTIRTDNRTIYEATLDVRYGQRYNDMNARLYRHLDLFFGFAGLFGGSGALLAAISEYKTLGIVAGAVVAAVAVVERLVRPIEKAVAHDDFKIRFAVLAAEVDVLPLQEIERRLIQLQAQAPSGLASLNLPAFNDNLLANGRSDWMAPTTGWQRFMAMLA